MIEGNERTALGTAFDQVYRSLHKRPDVTEVKPTTVRAVTPILELAQTFIIQTCRTRERGDTIFIEYIGTEGSVRLFLPPEVADVIARQRDALTTTNRKRAAKATAAARKAAGIVPAFLKTRRRGKANG